MNTTHEVIAFYVTVTGADAPIGVIRDTLCNLDWVYTCNVVAGVASNTGSVFVKITCELHVKDTSDKELIARAAIAASLWP